VMSRRICFGSSGFAVEIWLRPRPPLCYAAR
jgi:hypothetical protein